MTSGCLWCGARSIAAACSAGESRPAWGELIREEADERGRGIVALEVMPEHVHLFVEHDPKSSVS
ncbi:REP element-mobilizing transposase RayT [Saccharopolyspora lacisalsi]|uniref:REP element-mobilizing transposase RayT n=1 Tax=Halosaccharopolyspora lacisalsi TaxID=1000566 RepID=A0A839E1L2_9PSEU|nr:REP element-mobilizing transposase RayT [Halosaccharopolyspora lacisalsi]